MSKILNQTDEKNVSKTGLTGAALMAYSLLRMVKPEWADGMPPGVFEGLAAVLVIVFRRVSDGKKPKIV